MQTQAIIFQQPRQVEVSNLDLTPPSAEDVVVQVQYSGISTGTERLLWSGTMPPFPGMGYPLVPGYEAAGQIVEAGASQTHRIGDYVFVPGSSCFGTVRGLFGASAARLVVPAARAVTVRPSWGAEAVLLALAATAFHASAGAAPHHWPRRRRPPARPHRRIKWRDTHGMGNQPRPLRRRRWLPSLRPGRRFPEELSAYL